MPPYRHLPGTTPHPRRDPTGHSYRQPENVPETFRPERWAQTPEYLHGVDLYNLAYYWEAHETWEGLWKVTERDSLSRVFLQGLIQISAALLKRELEVWRGMRSLSRAGLEKLERVEASHSVYCGIRLQDYLCRLEKIFGTADRTRWEADPRILIDKEALQGGSESAGPPFRDLP